MPGRIISAGPGPASVWCVPNLITAARIAVVPVFVWLLVADAAASPHGPLRWWTAGLFVAAIATDALDGHLARSRGLVTDLGKLLDPIADKAITGAAFLGLAALGELPWWVAIVVIARELGITLWRLVEARLRILPAGRGGKAKTILQAVALSAALAPLERVLGAAAATTLDVILMTAAVLLTIVSGLDYLWRAYGPGARDAEVAAGLGDTDDAVAAVAFDDPEHP